MAPSDKDAPSWLSIVGRPLSNGDATLIIGADGTVTGGGFDGTWEERDGRYCRTLTKPAQFAGTECQEVFLDGDQVTFKSPQGHSVTWTVG